MEQWQVHAGEKDHAQPGWTTSICGQEQLIKMTENKDKSRKYIHDVANH